jgi:hypothetical protein
MKHELLRFVEFEQTKPFDYARMWYGLFCANLFEDDLAEYLRNGCVVTNPKCLMFFRPINLAKEGEPDDLAWYVRFAYGPLIQLVNAFPAYLPKLAYYRAGFGKPKEEQKMRVVSYDKLKRLAEKGQELYGQ